MLIWEIERGSVAPRLSDLEPDGRRSWPLGGGLRGGRGSRAGGRGAVVGTWRRGQGGTWGRFDECRRMDELSINLRPRNAGALSQRGERTRFYPEDKAISIRQREISWSDKMPMGEGMTSRAQCDHAEVEIKRDEGRKRSARLRAPRRDARRLAGTIDCRTILLASAWSCKS
jgi:hypothetical protein